MTKVLLTTVKQDWDIGIFCRKCRQIIVEGCYTILIGIDGREWWLGKIPMPKCCEESHALPLLYNLEPDAQKKKDEIAALIYKGLLSTIPLVEPIVIPQKYEMN